MTTIEKLAIEVSKLKKNGKTNRLFPEELKLKICDASKAFGIFKVSKGLSISSSLIYGWANKSKPKVINNITLKELHPPKQLFSSFENNSSAQSIVIKSPTGFSLNVPFLNLEELHLIISSFVGGDR